MNYQVEYKDQNRATSEIDAASPLEAAELYFQRDSEMRWRDYNEIVVSWGLFGKQRESFSVQDLLPPVAPKEVAQSETRPVLPPPLADVSSVTGNARGALSYWYGYLYAAFWGWVMVACGAFAQNRASKPPIPGDVQSQAAYWTAIVLSCCAVLFFAYSTALLLLHLASLRLIYALAAVHGAGVVLRGIRPIDLILWFLFSGVVVLMFREERKQADGKNVASPPV